MWVLHKDSRRSGATEPQRRTAPVENSTSNALVSQYDGIGCYDWSYQAEEEPANFALMNIIKIFFCLESVKTRLGVYKQNESILEENIKLLNITVQARDTTLVTLRQKLNQAEQERDDLKLKLDKFQTSSKNLTKLLASQTNEKHGLGYCSSESDCKSLSPSSPFDRLQPSGAYHLSSFKPAQALSHTTRPLAPIIEDWVSDSEDESEINDPQSVPSCVQSSEQVKTPGHSVQPSKSVSITAVRPVCAALPKIMVTRPRHAHSIDTKSKSPIRRYISCISSPKTSNSPPRVTAAQALVVSAAKGKKGKW
nr:hypothetical protein [Tanacetum cinerariifolium]